MSLMVFLCSFFMSKARKVLNIAFFSCQYLAEKFCPDKNDETLLRDHTVCLCDDDNDIEMASACRHAYIPDVTSQNMAATIEKFPEHFTITGGEGLGKEGPAASEAALMKILDSLEFHNGESPQLDEGEDNGKENEES